MIKRTSRDWIPFWGDKWLFGSMRIEFDVAERGIWWDLMSIAMKDEGFIRANEDTPYLIQQLAGMLIVPEDLLERTIEKFIEKGKYTRLKNGTLYITNWNKYCFTDRHMRRLEADADDEMSAETDTMSGNEDREGAVADTREEKRRLDKIRLEKNRKEKKTPSSSSSKKTNNPKIEFSFEGRKFLYITIEDKAGWRDAFPAVDVEQELRGMREWLLSNPTKRKSNYRKFITNWLSRQQDKGGTKSSYEDKRKKKLDDWAKKPEKE